MVDCSASVPIDRDSFQRYVPAQPDRSDDSASGVPGGHQQPADPADVGSVALDLSTFIDIPKERRTLEGSSGDEVNALDKPTLSLSAVEGCL